MIAKLFILCAQIGIVFIAFCASLSSAFSPINGGLIAHSSIAKNGFALKMVQARSGHGRSCMCRQCSTRIGPLRAAPVSETGFRKKDVTSLPALEASNAAMLELLASKGTVSYEDAFTTLTKYENAVKTVEEHFPGVLASSDLLVKSAIVLEKFGIDGDNTLFAQSLCPDEINHEEGGLSDLFTTYMGEVFHLGGLGGLPFPGKTGFAAYSHHVPENGNLFVLFGPHIGISSSSVLGMYSRKGQLNDGSACGAAVGAYKYNLGQTTVPTIEDLTKGDFSDYQMKFIIAEVGKRKDLISAKTTTNEVQAELAKQVYAITEDFINKVVNPDFAPPGPDGKRGKLILLGGIQVNMPHPMKDFFQPLMFESRTHGEPTVDLFEQAFGHKPNTLA